MASSAAMKNGRAHLASEADHIHTAFSTPLRPASRRTPSFSSSPLRSSNSSIGSLSMSSPNDMPIFSPRTPLSISGIPFCWEHLPGIPKQQTPKKKDTTASLSLLPLPPAGTPKPSKNSNRHECSKHTTERDPFIAALVECSKDDRGQIGSFWKGSKISKTLCDRFGFVSSYTSCRSNIAVSQSIVHLPRPRAHNLYYRRPS